MAKLDLKMQFNDQCFLVTNPGIVHKAIKLPRRATARGSVVEEFVFYTAANVRSEDVTENIVPTDNAHIFQNYFENYFKSSQRRGLNMAPPADFTIFKSYPAKKQGGKQVDVKLPINADFQNLTYSDTMSGIKTNSHIEGFSGTGLGHAQVVNFSIDFNGKDFATADIADCRIDLELDSLQALMRYTRMKGTDGETYLVSISDLIRLPLKEKDSAADPWASLKENIGGLLQGDKATSADIRKVVGDSKLGEEAAEALASSYNESKGLQGEYGGLANFPGVDGILDTYGTSGFKSAVPESTQNEIKRHFLALEQQKQLGRLGLSCPAGPDDSLNKQKAANSGFYQIKVEWGYTEDSEGKDIWANPGAYKALRSALYLTLYSHEIDYTAEGAILLKLKYIGHVQNVLDSVQSNILKLTEEENQALSAMHQMQKIFGDLGAQVSGKDFNNISFKARRAASLLAGIPGIHSDPGKKKGIMPTQFALLKPLWKHHKGESGWHSGDTENVFNIPDRIQDASYWSGLASFMKSSIDQFLSITRQRRYGKLYDLLLNEQRIYTLDVPYNYIGFDENLMALIGPGGTISETMEILDRFGANNEESKKLVARKISEQLSKQQYARAHAGSGAKGALPAPITDIEVPYFTAAEGEYASAMDLLNSVRVVEGSEEYSFTNTEVFAQAAADIGASIKKSRQELEANSKTPKPKPDEQSAEWWEGAALDVFKEDSQLGNKRRIYFTTIGHVFECICQIIGFRSMSTPYNVGGGLNVRIIFGPLETTGIFRQDGIDKTKEMTNFEIENIGDIPIALTLLQEFWKEKIIGRGREVYTLDEFIRDFTNYFLAVALGKECNIYNGTRTNKISVDYIQSNYPAKASKKVIDATKQGEKEIKERTPTEELSWPAPWKRAITKSNLKNVFKESRLERSDNSTATDDVITYVIVRARSDSLPYLNPSDLFGKNPKIKLPVISPPKRADNASGKVRKLKFKRAEQKFVREARLTIDSNLHSNYIRDIYNCDVEILGIPTFRPGAIVYIDPVMPVGKYADDPIVNINMINNVLGMGGFYNIIKVRHTLVRGKKVAYTTELEGIWNSFGGCKPKPIRPLNPAVQERLMSEAESKRLTAENAEGFKNAGNDPPGWAEEAAAAAAEVYEGAKKGVAAGFDEVLPDKGTWFGIFDPLD